MSLDQFLEEWNNSSPAILVHTSGSTGKPKPMLVEKQKMQNSAHITCSFLNLHPNDNALLCMPLDYIAGKMMVVRAVSYGMNIINVPPSNHPLASIADNKYVCERLLDDYFIDIAAMVPSQVYCSLQVPEEREMLRRIRHLIIGGGAVSAELQHELQNLYSDEESETHCIWSTYGMTETLSHIALRRLNGRNASDWYTPLQGVKVWLNGDGCLCIDAPLVHDGILETNDIAELHDGKFRIIGRKDNVICSGGIKLNIEEIEDKLSSLLSAFTDGDESASFCITKCPDEKFGEIAVLLITNRIGITDEELHDVFAHLDRYSAPKRVVRVDYIPLTKTGKIDRAESFQLAKNNLL